MTEELKDKVWELLFYVRRSRRYHSWRLKFFSRLVNLRLALTFIFSSAALVVALQKWGAGDWVAPLVGVVALVSVLEYVLRIGPRADLHKDLLRSFVELEKDILSKGEGLTEKQYDMFRAKIAEIEMDEPPVLHSLNRLCHNAEVKARFPDGEWQKWVKEVTFMQRVFASVLDIAPHVIPRKQKGTVPSR